MSGTGAGLGSREQGSRRHGAERVDSFLSVQPGPPPAPPLGAIALLLLACFPYIVLLAVFIDMPGGDPAGYGGEGRIAVAFSQLYALASGILLWIALGALLLIGWINGRMPRWAAILAGVLYPLSAIAAFAAVDLSYSYPGGWLVLVPALLPPMIALYALWARLPALHAVLRPDAASIVLLGAIAIVIIVMPARVPGSAPIPRAARTRTRKKRRGNGETRGRLGNAETGERSQV